jgi:hypothetical protein
MTTSIPERPPTRTPHDDRCPHCNAPLEEDQEWCLECGAARTLIHRPPDWRIPLAIVGGTAAVAVLIFVLVISNLGGGGGSAGAAAAGVTVSAHNAPARGSFPGWPQGLGGWTVAVFRSRDRAAAYARARKAATNGIQVGVLDSSLHPGLHPGRWIVWSGRYPTKSRASAAATQLLSLGQAHARPLLVGRPT